METEGSIGHDACLRVEMGGGWVGMAAMSNGWSGWDGRKRKSVVGTHVDGGSGGGAGEGVAFQGSPPERRAWPLANPAFCLPAFFFFANGIIDENTRAPANTTTIATIVSSRCATRGNLLFNTCERSRGFAQAARCVQEMGSLVQSQSLGGRGAIWSSHWKRSDAPVRNVQAHAAQQRTRGAAGPTSTMRLPMGKF